MKKKTVVIGASTNTERYSNKAIRALLNHGHIVKAIGLQDGEVVEGVIIQKGSPKIDDVDTVTLYVGPKNQPEYYEYIVSLQPKRIIFNPGTENPEFYEIAKKNGVEVEIACTLVLLATGQF